MGPKLRVLWPKQFFIFFLLEINSNDLLWWNINFGKNMLKFDLYRLKLGFKGPKLGFSGQNGVRTLFLASQYIIEASLIKN